jgi:hypothetical protein
MTQEAVENPGVTSPPRSAVGIVLAATYVGLCLALGAVIALAFDQWAVGGLVAVVALLPYVLISSALRVKAHFGAKGHPSRRTVAAPATLPRRALFAATTMAYVLGEWFVVHFWGSLSLVLILSLSTLPVTYGLYRKILKP